MGIYAIKPKFQRSLRGAEAWLIDHHVHPDTITVSALVLSCLGGAALAFSPQHLWLLWTIPLVAIGRTALNALDGMVAVKTGVARPFGEVLNEFSDRLADAALFAGIAFSGLVNPNLAWITVLAAVLSDDLGVLSKAAGGPRQYGGAMGKADRMIFLSAFSVVGFFLPFPWLWAAFETGILVGCLLTIMKRWRQTYADL